MESWRPLCIAVLKNGVGAPRCPEMVIVLVKPLLTRPGIFTLPVCETAGGNPETVYVYLAYPVPGSAL
jgi:hypothetical protein